MGAEGERRGGGELEAEILALLHREARPMTPGQVLDGLGGSLSYSTVVTTLSRLYAKEILRRTRRGRAYAYTPVADDSGLAARHMRQFLEQRPDREAVLTRFVSDLSAGDEELLRRLLVVSGEDEAAREGET